MPEQRRIDSDKGRAEVAKLAVNCDTIVEKHVEAAAPMLIGVDYGKGPDMSAEVEGRVGPDGKIEITDVRSWSHELELKAEPEVPDE